MFGIGVIHLTFHADIQETVFGVLGFTPAGPAIGTAASAMMQYLGGAAGIKAGSLYAVAQSASMGGTATGVIATVGAMPAVVVAAVAAVPIAVAVGMLAL